MWMDISRGVLGIKRIQRIPNTRGREFYVVKKTEEGNYFGILKAWKIIGLIKCHTKCIVYVIFHWVEGLPVKKKKRFGCGPNKENRP